MKILLVEDSLQLNKALSTVLKRNLILSIVLLMVKKPYYSLNNAPMMRLF